MKRNDFATYIVYLGMIAIALLVGFLVVRPILSNWSSDYGLLTVILSVLGGAILNSIRWNLATYLARKPDTITSMAGPSWAFPSRKTLTAKPKLASPTSKV
jgi:hypothetical protein